VAVAVVTSPPLLLASIVSMRYRNQFYGNPGIES
jgi:hypothetical protein